MTKSEDIFGERLKVLRKKIGKSQERVATDIGISRARYSHYENNHVEPDIDLIRRLADYFEVDTDYLLGRTRTPENRLSGSPGSQLEIVEIIKILDLESLLIENKEEWEKITKKDIEELKNYLIYLLYKISKKEKND